jgi:transcriptional regulator with PAS, ATPase and Fis domain
MNAQKLALQWVFPKADQPVIELSLLGTRELGIGRDGACAVRLEGGEVSRRHATLKLGSNGTPLIVDLGSRNGVRVNGVAIASSQLHAGDFVRLGGWLGVVTTAAGALTEIAPGLLGGAVLQAAVAPLQRAAQTDLSIVLEGETGTGKEVVARSLHRWSGRAGPLVAVNCAALPEGLAEAELFGYRRGAFTGADRPSPGFFRSAHGGTLFLDEVCDLPLPVQGKLLRVLEAREVQPLGEVRPIPIDVRIVVAGQRSLLEVAREGRFRADLVARLDGLTVRLPALRQRPEDIPQLFLHLLEAPGDGRAARVGVDLVERLCLHDWPFNIRELVQVVRQLSILCSGDSKLESHHLPERIASRVFGAVVSEAGTRTPPAVAGLADSVGVLELVGALRTAGGNVARASAMLGITRQRAYRLMEGHSIDLESLRNATGEGRR